MTRVRFNQWVSRGSGDCRRSAHPSARADFSHAASGDKHRSRGIEPDAQIGDVYLIKLTKEVTGYPVPDVSTDRPMLLWGIYRDLKGKILGADFLSFTTRTGGAASYLFDASWGVSEDGRKMMLICSSIYRLANIYPDDGGFVYGKGRFSRKSPFHAPTVIARRSFNALRNSCLRFFSDSIFDPRGTVREGIPFLFLERRHIRDNDARRNFCCGHAPEINDPANGFSHRFVPLPGVKTPEMAERLAFWSSFYNSSKVSNSTRAWPDPASRLEDWPFWDEAARALERKKQDGRPLFRDWIAKPPGSSPARYQGYSSSALQPPEPSRP